MARLENNNMGNEEENRNIIMEVRRMTGPDAGVDKLERQKNGVWIFVLRIPSGLMLVLHKSLSSELR